MSSTNYETESNGLKNIIVEGVECSGKTTLIDEIRRKIPGWDLKYLTHQDGNQFNRYMWEYMVNNGTIFNRGHYSEVIYSSLHDRSEPFDKAQGETLGAVASSDCLVIFSDPNLDDVIERYKQRETTQPIKLDELEIIHSSFRTLFEEVPCVRYESTDMSARDIFVSELPALLTRKEGL